MEKALAACQFARDRLDFIEPMYWAVRRGNDGLWAVNRDIRARTRGAEAGRAEIAEECDIYRSAAAYAHRLREELAAARHDEANAEDDICELIRHLRVDPRTGGAVYQNGPNSPPSARRRAPKPAGDG